MQSLDSVFQKHRIILLALVCLILFGAGMASLPVTDRDEARYVQASKQMLETGDYLDIRFQDEPRYKKPIGIYWLHVASHKVLPPFEPALDAIAVYRLPSLLGALGAVLLLFYSFRRTLGEREATIAALLLACSLITVVEAHLAKTDAMLLLSAVMVLGGLHRLHEAQHHGVAAGWHWRLILWGGLGLSILLKGPIIPFIFLVCLLSLKFYFKEKSLRSWLQPWPWLLLPIVIAAPWLIFIQKASDGAFAQEALFQDFIPKLLDGQESHGAPPFYYLLLSPLLLWPSSLIIGLCLPHWRQLASPTSRLLLSWLIPAWIVFELVPTKLPHYILPLVPAIVGLTAIALPLLRQHFWVQQKRWRSVQYLWLGVWIIATLALALAPGALRFIDSGVLSVPSLLASLLLLIMAGITLRHLWQRHLQRLLAFCLALSLLVYPLVFFYTLPNLTQPWLARDIAALRATLDPLAHRPVALCGYREPSAVFYLGTDTTLLGDGGHAADFIYENPFALVFVADKHDDAFQEGLLRHGIEAEALSSLAGFNYSRGKPVTLTVYQAVIDTD